VGRFICRVFFFTLFGLLGSLTAFAEAPVWAIRGAHNTVYLAGSVHLLRSRDATLPAAFDRAYKDADTLVMEIDLDDLDPAAAQTWMLEHGMIGDEKTLGDIIGKQRFQRVEQEGNRLGLPVEGLQQLEPWLVAMTLAQLQYMKLGFHDVLTCPPRVHGRRNATQKRCAHTGDQRCLRCIYANSDLTHVDASRAPSSARAGPPVPTRCNAPTTTK